MTIKAQNVWKGLALSQNWSDEDFEREIILLAQAVLAFKLSKEKQSKIDIASNQYDGDYKLSFEKIN
tara:strand:+ start:307 stop:507 length:201 start_codon:yes stop_codon:yes gene_type:complete